MTLHYHDAGSGPHDTAPRKDDGLRNCGCHHDGTTWLDMCASARKAHDERRQQAALDHTMGELL